MMTLSRSVKYFRSICNLVYDNRFGKSYTKLFEYLYSRDFYWDIPLDKNRALDGIDLRYKYGCDNDLIGEPCTVLEMLVALAVRVENHLQSSFELGDRTSQWFWIMLTNLGLNRMDDDNFDEETAEWFVSRFLNREYHYDGTGGALFVVERPFQDLKVVDIWTQVNWYLGEVDGYL